MGILLTTALAGSLFIMTGTDAEARRGGSTAEDMVFVLATGIPGPSDRLLSLCMLVERHPVLFAPVFTTAESCVMAANRRETNS